VAKATNEVKQVNESRADAALSPRFTLTAPAQPTTVAGFSTFRKIITACERGEPLPPQIEALGNYLALQASEIANILKTAFEGAPSKEVARLFTQFPHPVMEMPIEDIPKRIREIVKWFEVHQRKLPKRFRKFVAKQLARNSAIKPPKIHSRKPVTVATPKAKCIRTPNSREKANNEDAEGDADSHSDFWFAAVMPRAQRAPNFRAAHRGGSGRLGLKSEPLTR
jgi:hypothetical protein